MYGKSATSAFLKWFDVYAWYLVSEFSLCVHVRVCVCGQFDMLELDRFAKPLVSCPLLLDAASYFPDTEDLTIDQEARDYWLQCFVDATDKVPATNSHSPELPSLWLYCWVLIIV